MVGPGGIPPGGRFDGSAEVGSPYVSVRGRYALLDGLALHVGLAASTVAFFDGSSYLEPRAGVTLRLLGDAGPSFYLIGEGAFPFQWRPPQDPFGIREIAATGRPGTTLVTGFSGSIPWTGKAIRTVLMARWQISWDDKVRSFGPLVGTDAHLEHRALLDVGMDFTVRRNEGLFWRAGLSMNPQSLYPEWLVLTWSLGVSWSP
jgi:hypothetical protein